LSITSGSACCSESVSKSRAVTAAGLPSSISQSLQFLPWIRHRHAQARAMARGTHEPTSKYNNELEPLASIQSDGTLIYSEEFTKELQEANGQTNICTTDQWHR
jgi:hypothetical protein